MKSHFLLSFMHPSCRVRWPSFMRKPLRTSGCGLGVLALCVLLLAGCGAGPRSSDGTGKTAPPVPRRNSQASQGKILDGVYISADEQLRVKTPGKIIHGMGGAYRYDQSAQGVRNVTFVPFPGAAPTYSLTVVPTRLPREARAAAGHGDTSREELRKATLRVESRAVQARLGAEPEQVFSSASEGRYGPVDHLVLRAEQATIPGCRRLSGAACQQPAIVSMLSFGTEDWTAVLTVTQYVKAVDEKVLDAHRQRSVLHVGDMMDSLVIGDAVR